MSALNDKLLNFSYLGYSETELHNMILSCKEKGIHTLVTKITSLESRLALAGSVLKECWDFIDGDDCSEELKDKINDALAKIEGSKTEEI